MALLEKPVSKMAWHSRNSPPQEEPKAEPPAITCKESIIIYLWGASKDWGRKARVVTK